MEYFILYRSILEVTGGCVCISSEYSSASVACPGRVDFFFPSKKWSVELFHDGNNVREHSSHFLVDGASGAWVESLDMTDYIILDFRCTRPQESHDGKLSFLQLGTNLTSDII